MKRKIIIWNFLIVLMLTLSIASVVGSEPSVTEIQDSPLYSIRTDNAINNNGEELSTSYIGENEELVVPMELNKEVYEAEKNDDVKFTFDTCCPFSHNGCCPSAFLPICAHSMLHVRPACWDPVAYSQEHESSPLYL
jgi:hypothetical protein